MSQYHNALKKRIKTGQMLDYKKVKNYPKVGECLLIYFNCHPDTQFVRPHSYWRYENILKGINL